MAEGYMDLFIEVIIAVALFGPLVSYVTTAAENASGTTALLLNLIPILYVIVIVAGFVFVVKGKMHKK